jgi:nicotinamide-nucleotide amidase
MKKASIVSVGNELLAGWTVDTNAAYLAGQLLSIDIQVAGIYTVGDEIETIVNKLNLACADAELVLVTGGLGPTDDDLTRQAFAKFLGVELVLDNEILNQIRGFFTHRNWQMPERNNIQAYIPASAKAIENKIGTAPGIIASSKGRMLIAMPGVPTEMKEMFQSIVPELRRFTGEQTVVTRKLRCFGAGESAIADMLGDMMQRGRNPLVNCTVEMGVVTLYVIASHKDAQKAGQMADKAEKILRDKLGDIVFGTGEQKLAEVVGEELARQGKTVATAESCTGGLLAKLLTDIPGASRYFTQGWITYSNDAKTSELGVPSDMLEKYGAVSEQVAEAMAKGARQRAKTDFAIGITGIAGPTGQTQDKPAGLVYISIASEKTSRTERYIFRTDRESVRNRSAHIALNLLRLMIM